MKIAQGITACKRKREIIQGEAKASLFVFYIYKVSILEVTFSRVPSPGAYTQTVSSYII
jgi:hypothetical protein